MEAISWFGEHFIGLFKAGGEQFTSYMTGIIPLLIVLLTFTNSVIAFIGQERVERAIRACSRFMILRYTVMPILSVLILTNPMCYTFGRFVKEEEKVAFYDSAVSFIHPVTGIFPYANAGELFVWLGISQGVEKAGHSSSSLAVMYLLVGIIVMLGRGVLTDTITKFLIKREAKKAAPQAAIS